MEIALIIISVALLICVGFLAFQSFKMRYYLRKCSFMELMELEKDFRKKYEDLPEKKRKSVEGKIIVSIIKSIDRKMKLVANRV